MFAAIHIIRSALGRKEGRSPGEVGAGLQDCAQRPARPLDVAAGHLLTPKALPLPWPTVDGVSPYAKAIVENVRS